MPDRNLTHRLIKRLGPLVQGAQDCLDANLRSPTLVLVYSGIDIAGWIYSRYANQGPRSTFTTWAERYLRPEARFGCSALDLYGARCGLLHRSSPDSHLAERGECRRVLYTWGDADPRDLQQTADALKSADYVSVHIGELIEGFRRAFLAFVREAERFPPARRDSVDAKLRRTFKDVPKEPVERYVDLLDGSDD